MCEFIGCLWELYSCDAACQADRSDSTYDNPCSITALALL